jgi:hypothetical protein
MRTLKSGLTTVIAIGLLAGSAVGVAAQPEGEAAYVTGTIAFSGSECADGGGDWFECPISLDASDSRLSGEGSWRNASVPMQSDDELVVLVNQSLRVATDEGAWTGGGLLYATPTNEDAVGVDEPTWVLSGEGAYDGLTAVLRADLGPDGSFAGVIVGAEPPAAPPVPPAE